MRDAFRVACRDVRHSPILRRASGFRVRSAPLVAIAAISFDLKAGTLVTLLGPSGCGKTTFLRIAAASSAPTSGIVQINGREVIEPQPDFGIAFQQSNLMPWRSVLKNVLFPMEIRRENGRAARDRAMRAASAGRPHGFETAYPAQLSGGMQQRVALCRALIHRPKLLLMDEPFGALDELTRMEMQDLLLDIRAKTRATVLFVTHSISEAIYLSDAVVVFSKRPAVIADHIEVDPAVSAYAGDALSQRVHRARAPCRPRAGDHAMKWRPLARAVYPLIGVAVILLIWQAYTAYSPSAASCCRLLPTSCSRPSRDMTFCCARPGPHFSKASMVSAWRSRSEFRLRSALRTRACSI